MTIKILRTAKFFFENNATLLRASERLTLAVDPASISAVVQRVNILAGLGNGKAIPEHRDDLPLAVFEVLHLPRTLTDVLRKTRSPVCEAAIKPVRCCSWYIMHDPVRHVLATYGRHIEIYFMLAILGIV